MINELAPPKMILSPREKAAIVVRFLIQEGADIDVGKLPNSMQASLTQTIGSLGIVDRQTLSEVVTEFANTLGNIGLGSTGGLAGALSFLNGKIAPDTARKLEKEAGLEKYMDPWDRLRVLEIETLSDMVKSEGIEVSAVLLSKLDVAKAAQVLTTLDGPHARSISYAISKTDNVTPMAVERIGQSLVAQLDDQPERAFSQAPELRVGAILTITNPTLREEVLKGLEESDPELAERVRKAVFTFDDIPKRITPSDVAKAIRPVPTEDLVKAMAYAAQIGSSKVCDFIFDNLSRRMATSIKEEIDDLGDVKEAEGENAINAVIGTIQNQVANGEIQWTFKDVE